MITDYFFKNYIITTHEDHNRNIFKIEVYNKINKKHYKTTDKKQIENITKIIK